MEEQRSKRQKPLRSSCNFQMLLFLPRNYWWRSSTQRAMRSKARIRIVKDMQNMRVLAYPAHLDIVQAQDTLTSGEVGTSGK
jgi:hypothetical protein